MKKAVKIMIFVALGLLVVGTAMAFVSVAAAGFNMKNIIPYTDAEYKEFDITEDYSDIDLEIEWDSVEICKSGDGNTHFTCYLTEGEDYDVKVEEDTLKIKSIDKSASFNTIFSFNLAEDHAKLYLPKEEYDNLCADVESGSFMCSENLTFSDADIDCGSGSLKLSEMTFEDLSAKISSGSSKLENINADSIDLNNGSGSAELNSVKAGTIKAKSSSGSVKANNVEAKSAELKAGSGSVTTENVTCEEDLRIQSSSGSLHMTETVAGNKLEGKTGSGSIHLDACDGADINLQTGSGSIKGTVKTSKMFSASSGAGSVKVPEDDDNGGKCVLHSGSGSINVSLVGEEMSETAE